MHSTRWVTVPTQRSRRARVVFQDMDEQGQELREQVISPSTTQRRKAVGLLMARGAICAIIAAGMLPMAHGVEALQKSSHLTGVRVHWMQLRGGFDDKRDGGMSSGGPYEDEPEGTMATAELIFDAERKEDGEVTEVEKGLGMWIAAEEGDEEELEDLATRGTNVNTTVHSEHNAGPPLHWAAMKGQLGTIRKLLTLGADVNGQSKKDNQTALHWAASKGMSEACRLLHSHGGNINAVDACGWTPLHSAAYWGKEDTCSLLLSLGADAGSVDIEGDTPLHNAAYRGWTGVANLLVQYGAELGVENMQERVPEDVAEWCGHASLAEGLARVRAAGISARARGHTDFTLRVWTPPGHTDDSEGKVHCDVGV